MIPVGSLPDGGSPYGVKDMAGDAREWVSDWYDADYYKDAPARGRGGFFLQIPWHRLSVRPQSGAGKSEEVGGFSCKTNVRQSTTASWRPVSVRGGGSVATPHAAAR